MKNVFQLVPLEIDTSNYLYRLREMLKVQGVNGNWNSDPYMHGMYNGMEYALSIFENREPLYRNAPEKWLADSKGNDHPTVASQ